MATKNTKSKPKPAPPPEPQKIRRQGIALRPQDYAIMARLEARWFPERSEYYRPSIADVMRKALDVAERSGMS